MGNPIRRILKIGLQNTLPVLEYRKVLITNYLAFFCSVGSFTMGCVSLLIPFYSQVIICFVSSLLYGTVTYLNAKGYYRASSVWFIILSTIILISLSLVSILEGMPSGVENIFVALMIVPLLLLEGKVRNYTYWLLFLMLLAVKITRFEANEIRNDLELIVNILNWMFTAGFIFLVFTFFKRVLFKAVERTNEHEKTLYSLLDNVPVFMALVDTNGTYKIANRSYSNMFGHHKNEIIGKKREKILPKNILDAHDPYFKKVLDTKEPVSFLENNKMPDGSNMYSRGTYVPIKDGHGNILAISIYVDNVSELVEAEESLKRASQTKDKLFSIIAHDIRSPLNLFQSILNVSGDEIISKEEFFNYQGELKTRLSSLSERLDELLDWARMQMGGISAYPKEVDVNEVVKENVELFRTLIEKKKIDFNVILKSDLDGWMDENHLQVAIRNLLHNSLKYTDEEGEVTIETSQDDDSVLVEIIDSGQGMTKEVVDSIMKREIQKSIVGTSGEVGTGLGLSLSLGLLKKNECIFTIDSEVGRGSTFRIWIPKSDINDPVFE